MTTAHGVDRSGAASGSGEAQAPFIDTFLDADTVAAALDALGVSTFTQTLLDDLDGDAVIETVVDNQTEEDTPAPDDLVSISDISANDGRKVRLQSLVARLQSFGGALILNGKITRSVGSSALTVALKTLADADPSAASPVYVLVPTVTSNVFDGGYAVRKITAALSVVVSSGSTLGHASAVASPVYIYLLDNAGTLEFAVSNKFFGGVSVASTTAEGGAGAADSATTLYSTTARSNVSVACLQRWKSTQTTAGTWAATTGEVQLYPFPYKAPSVQVFTASGTYTKPWDALAAKVTVVGGGGGSGGCAATPASNSATAGGGGGGGTAIKTYNVSVISATETVTVGAGGAAATAGSNAGGAGGTSSFGSLCSATGGGGGNGGGASAADFASGLGGSGGVGSGGDLNISGGGGGSGCAFGSSQTAIGGSGGASHLGGGSTAVATSGTTSGTAGGAYGGGAGGSASGQSQAAAAGSAGAAGIVIVEEVYA